MFLSFLQTHVHKHFHMLCAYPHKHIDLHTYIHITWHLLNSDVSSDSCGRVNSLKFRIPVVLKASQARQTHYSLLKNSWTWEKVFPKSLCAKMPPPRKLLYKPPLSCGLCDAIYKKLQTVSSPVSSQSWRSCTQSLHLHIKYFCWFRTGGHELIKQSKRQVTL